MRISESLVAGGPPGTAAEPEIAIGELDGPFGTAFAMLLGDQTKGHSKVLAILNTDMMMKPATLMVSKVTVKNSKYTNILMGTVQGAIATPALKYFAFRVNIKQVKYPPPLHPQAPILFGSAYPSSTK